MPITKAKFRIPSDSLVFVLDDNEVRLSWFRQRVPHATFAKTSHEALRLLETTAFKVVFLDHDLGWIDAAFPDRLHSNGKEVARFLARTKFPGIVVIHSVSETGAKAMKGYLKHARIAPFGTFEIELI